METEAPARPTNIMALPTIWVLTDGEGDPLLAGMRATGADAECVMLNEQITYRNAGKTTYGTLTCKRPFPHQTNDDAVKAWQKHHSEYAGKAGRIGIPALRSLLLARRVDFLYALAEGDDTLNSIPLSWWDSMHGLVMQWAFRDAHFKAWSLGDTGCVLKHVAIHHVAPMRR